jgi:hypothetical protein
MTLYLLDANVLIRANGDYYPIDRIEPFWIWLLEMAEADLIKIPEEIYDEVAESKDLLGQWLRRPEVKAAIILDERTDIAFVQKVIAKGYAPDLTDVEIVKVGADPFLVAATKGSSDRIVVTREVARPNAQRANRKVPDVCATFNVQCITDFHLWRLLNFRIQ